MCNKKFKEIEKLLTEFLNGVEAISRGDCDTYVINRDKFDVIIYNPDKKNIEI